MASNDKSANLMRQIDENLRRVYRQDEEADVPDRFQKLLQQLKEREAKGEAEDREQDSADE